MRTNFIANQLVQNFGVFFEEAGAKKRTGVSKLGFYGSLNSRFVHCEDGVIQER